MGLALFYSQVLEKGSLLPPQMFVEYWSVEINHLFSQDIFGLNHQILFTNP